MRFLITIEYNNACSRWLLTLVYASMCILFSYLWFTWRRRKQAILVPSMTKNTNLWSASRGMIFIAYDICSFWKCSLKFSFLYLINFMTSQWYLIHFNCILNHHYDAATGLARKFWVTKSGETISNFLSHRATLGW